MGGEIFEAAVPGMDTGDTKKRIGTYAMGTAGQAGEIAAMIAVPAPGEASPMAGQMMNVDGGFRVDWGA